LEGKHLKIGIISKRGAGKTTIFNILTGAKDSQQKSGFTLGVAFVPDERVDFLSAMYMPKKTIHAQITVVDFASIGSGAKDSDAAKQARSVDALLLVLGAFVSDPLQDLDETLSDLVISDLGQVERAIERLTGKRGVSQEELSVLEACRERLENGELLGELGAKLPVEYNMITIKPIIVALNVPEEEIRDAEAYPELHERARALGLPVVPFCASVEEEIATMESAEDRKMFMEEYGLTEPGLDRLARTAYARLGLISFFTVGQDEVRAWTIERDCSAKQAAGAIHSDIERGFIRAEVVAYEDLKRLGSMKAVKDAGLFRLEAKEYPVKDGDIISFRFNV
jgi:ribosome-binding ATPase